jgi:hypothetical protein
VNSHETLKELAADARARVPNPPTWDNVREEATRLRLGAAHVKAAVVAGLASDEIWMTAADHWPDDINEPLRHLGLFDKYSPTTLRGVFAHLSDRQVGGLTNTVKGAALELHTVDAMNDGAMPMAHGATHAELFHPLNHPGADIKQLDADGHIVAHVQVKATEHWHTIARHLDRYPDVRDVATTHEGAQAMLQHGVDSHHILDTGIHAQALTDHVAAHMDNLGWLHFSHELVPELAIAAIVAVALLRLKNGEGLAETGAWVKEQATIAGLANAAGLAVQLATGTAALRPFAAIGTRLTAERGSVAQRTGEALRRVVSALGALRESATSRGYAAWSPSGTSPAPAA